ncbi:MAG TPA: alpha/beta hydrolase fold domain-containing protein [Vicinamibacterales bacterium]|nr:alpha/beta hydrolase fold domain-containing protein [Vicinamibacterales bacterium]
MSARWTSALAVLVFVVIRPVASYADAGLLRTIHALDEPRGYCLDVAGPPENLRLDEPLQAHTCKYGAPLDDQRFERAADGAVRAAMYNRCLAAAALEPGARLLLRACTATPAQRWSMAWGRLSPVSRPDLCIAVAGEKGEPAGTPILISPVYRHRDVVLERCADTREASQSFRWSRPDERGLSTAEVARNGMPADLAKQVAALGFSEGNIPQTYKLYASQPRVHEPSEIKVTKAVPYGAHERQRLDIHTATMRRSERPVPIIAVFHGGGLVGGMRENTSTFADYFASIGFVGVAAGYRLAPEFKWPEGGRDVGAVVTWLRDHAREYGGDPERIFVTGISSGSLHAATYVFRPELMPPGTARAAGAILLSGPYTFDFSAPNDGELAYFGEDKSRWPQMVVPGNVTRTDIPVLFTTAEYDDPRYLRAHAALFSELVGKHGVRPRFRQSLGHNHVSQLLSVGTVDTSVSREILDFIDRVTSR